MVARATRRTFLTGAAALGAVAVLPATAQRAVAGVAPVDRPILKPLPADRFIDFGTNAEMRWSSVDPRRDLTPQARLFVRNHTATPRIDARTWQLRVFGDGLSSPRGERDAICLSYADLRRLPRTRVVTTHECTGNGRSFFTTQQGESPSGTAWTLGAVGVVQWEGVRLAHVLRRLGIRRDAVSIQATGLDAPYVSDGVDYGRVRRPFPVDKALDDAVLAWGANGEPLLPDHGFPVRLVLPGWVGIANIKWLGSLEVSTSELTSPWNTKWYRMTGGDYPEDTRPLTINPVRSAWELEWEQHLERRRHLTLHGRSWSGAGPIRLVEVSADGGATWQRAHILRRGHAGGWARWQYHWDRPTRGQHVLMARATDAAGRTQPERTPFNDGGYFFDAVVRHPVQVS